MTLTEEQYNSKLMMLMHLGWDIYKFRLNVQQRTTVPNPYCEDLIDEAYESLKALLIQLKTHNVDRDGNDLNTNDNWWYPDIEKESKADVTHLAPSELVAPIQDGGANYT